MSSPFNATTLGKMAACQALGLEYWADHPATGCVWALDSERKPHVVRWYRKGNRAALQKVVERRVTFAAWAYPSGPNRVIRGRNGHYIEFSTYDISDAVGFTA